MENCTGRLKRLYDKMISERQPYLDRAREAIKYSMPSLLADEGKQSAKGNPQIIISPNQSVVADGINNLSSKVVMTLLPPNQTFYKFAVSKAEITKNAELKGVERDKYENAINKGLSSIEDTLLKYQEKQADRVCAGEAFKHLYNTGNVLLVDVFKEGLKYYPLDRYCVKRTYTGKLIRAIAKESISFYDLPNDIQKSVLEKYGFEPNDENKEAEKVTEKEDFELYTVCEKVKNGWNVYQEVEGFTLPDSKGTYPLDVCPFIPLRYTRIDGESYGRSLIEEYFGDIAALDALSLAVKDSALAASKLIFLVNPSGNTKVSDLTSTRNCGFCAGNPDDIQALQINKYNDLQSALTEIQRLESRLNRVFLMKAAIQRDAERVTAEEIKQMAQDLEEALGNHYALMSNEFQRAYVKIKFYHMKKDKGANIPDLLKDDSIELTVTTGLEALGRSSDLNKLTTFLTIMQNLAPAIKSLGAKIEAIAQSVALSMNLSIDGYFYSEAEKQEMAKSAMENELANKAIPYVMKTANDATQDNTGVTNT